MVGSSNSVSEVIKFGEFVSIHTAQSVVEVIEREVGVENTDFSRDWRLGLWGTFIRVSGA
jgi:hypothetical protein